MSAEPTSLSDLNREIDAIDRKDSMPSEGSNHSINHKIEAIESNRSPESSAPLVPTPPAQSTSSSTPEKPSESEPQEESEEPEPIVERPKRCNHIHLIKKKIKRFKKVKCERCPNTNAPITDRLVICLSCYTIGCGRQAKDQHAIQHYKRTKHNLVMTLPTFEEFNTYKKGICIEMMTIWCYKCDLFLHETDQDNTAKLKKIKSEIFGHVSRGYKRMSQFSKGSNNNTPKKPIPNNTRDAFNDSPNDDAPTYNSKKEKKSNKYAQFSKKNERISSRSSTSSLSSLSSSASSRKYQGDNVSASALQSWSKLEPEYITSMPNDKSNGYIGIFGLQNLGNTCFFNSILQNLAETRPLIKALTASSEVIQFSQQQIQSRDQRETQSAMSVDNGRGRGGGGGNNRKRGKGKRKNGRYNNYHQKMKQQEAEDKKLRGRLLTEFDHVISSARKVAGTNRATVVPSGLLNACAARNRRFAGRRQQDSHELMRVLVEGMRDQNEKILKKERENRLYRNLAKWTKQDIIDWFEFYEIDFHDTYYHREEQGLTAEDDFVFDITTHDFSDFIKSPKKYGINDFFAKIGLDQKRDPQFTQQFSRGRVYLANEECDFYCNKYGYDLVPLHLKHDTKKKKGKKSSSKSGGPSGDTEHSTIVDTKIRTIIDDVFGGELQSCVTCYGCGNTSRTTEEFFDLSLPISNPKLTMSHGFGGRRGGGSNIWLTAGKKKRNKKKNNKQSQWEEQNKRQKQNQQKSKKSKGKKGRKGNRSNVNIDDIAVIEAETKQNDDDDDDGMETVSLGTNNETETPSEIMSISSKNEEMKTDDSQYVPEELPAIRGKDRLKGTVNVNDCLAAFTDPELLDGDNKYRCKHCTRLDLEEKRRNGQLEHILAQCKGQRKKKKKEEIKENETKEDGDDDDDDDEEDGDDDGNDSNDDEEEEEDGFGDENGIPDDDIEYLLDEVPSIRQKAKKQILIHKPPQALALHLKRFEQHGFRLNKVSKKVRFPLHLDLTPYLTQECKENFEGHDENGKCIYQLYGISVHHGSMGGGHYIAYTHKYRENGPKDGWYYFSDSSYHSVKYEDAMRAEAYCLFYQRTERKVSESQSESADDIDNDDDVVME